MKRISYRVQSTFSFLFLAIALMSWFHTTAFDPKFLCVEDTTGINLESFTIGCCGSEIAPASARGFGAGNSDCDDCEDFALDLIVTAKRTGLAPCIDFSLNSTSLLTGPLGASVKIASFSDIDSRFIGSPLPLHVPVHLRTCAIPLIC